MTGYLRASALTLAAGAGLFAIQQSARADFTGIIVDVTQNYTNGSTSLNETDVGSPQEVTAGGTSFVAPDDSYRLDVTPSSLIFTFPTAYIQAEQFNGPVLTETGADITGVTIDPSSNPFGSSFTSSDISFTNDEISANFEGLTVPNPGVSVLTLDVTFGAAPASATPLPSAAYAGLGLLGCMGIAGLGRRRRLPH